MIIKCDNCNKKFNLDPSLIPKKGRTIQCGSCNHTWFYNPILVSTTPELLEKNTIEQPLETKVDIKKSESINLLDQKENINKENLSFNKNLNENKKLNKNFIPNKSNLNFNKFLSYIVACVISFIALIVILETFKSQLNSILPCLELVLYNLFETTIDIYLFLKDLFN